MRVWNLALLLSVSVLTAQAQEKTDDASAIFESRCAVCHGGDGSGGIARRRLYPTFDITRTLSFQTCCTKEEPKKGCLRSH